LINLQISLYIIIKEKILAPDQYCKNRGCWLLLVVVVLGGAVVARW
jgi:hypothetical protein